MQVDNGDIVDYIDKSIKTEYRKEGFIAIWLYVFLIYYDKLNFNILFIQIEIRI